MQLPSGTLHLTADGGAGALRGDAAFVVLGALKEGISKEDAEKLAEELKGAGAVAEVK